MAKNLDDAQEAILFLISQIDGLRKVSHPQERFNVDPFAVVTPDEVSWEKVSSGSVKGLHTITLEIHKVRKDLPRDLEIVKPFGELIKDKLLSDTNQVLPDSAGNATVDTVTGLDGIFGQLGWADVPTVGWIFTIGVKIWDTV